MAGDGARWPEGRYRDGVFDLGAARGFLPAEDPPAAFPSAAEAWAPLQALVDAIAVRRVDGQAGLLATPGAIVGPVEALPNLLPHVEALDAERDPQLLHLAYRAYSYVCAAYLLESSHHAQAATGEDKLDGKYGEARRVLPANVAQPFCLAAKKIGQHPWLEYHYGYALGNFVKIDPRAEDVWRWDNLRMACPFFGSDDERGFVMMHVQINSLGGALLGGISEAIDGADQLTAGGEGVDGAKALLQGGLGKALQALCDINTSRKMMWKASRPDAYNNFRVFIMGSEGNEPMFGDGVVYEGVEEFGGKPQKYRGETGAQDDIIPTCDIFSGVTAYYPENKLTMYLLNLRQYRPKCVQRFLVDLEEKVKAVQLRQRAEEDPNCLALLLGFVEQIFLFRNGHWQFVQRYILAQTKHATATGGTPITTWLPNQLEACLKLMEQLLLRLREMPGGKEALTAENRGLVDNVVKMHGSRVKVLHQQVEALKDTNYDAGLVYSLNAVEFDDPDAAIELQAGGSGAEGLNGDLNGREAQAAA